MSTLLPMLFTGTWCNQGVSPLFHYLDDYIMVAAPDPATIVTFLGIQIDAGKAKLRLSQEKLQRFCDLLEEWGDRKGDILKGLESLIGQLNHTCKVFRAGHSFLCCMIDLLHVVHCPPLSKSPTPPSSHASLPRTHLF